MKFLYINIVYFLGIAALAVIFTGCGMGWASKTPDSVSLSSVGSPGGAGNGDKVSGVGSLSVPAGPAVIKRVQNGLENFVSPTAGNFKKVLAQVQDNLPKVTDPLAATGYDQTQLMIYGACSDLTTGNTPLMKSKYNVDPNAAIAANQNALIMAGTRMLDRYVAGLASQGPTAAQVNAAFSQLLQSVSGTSGNTSKIAFMSVCLAANTAGSTLMGF